MSFSDAWQDIQNFDPQDIQWDRMGVWPLWVKIILCVILFSVVIALTYYLKIESDAQSLESKQREEAQLRKSFAQKSSQAANLDAYRSQMVEIEQSFQALLSQLPTDTEVPGLLEDINEKGSESGLEINSIQLQAEITKDYYVELPIDIRLTGGYHDFGSFVSGVSGMSRIVTLHDYTISKQGGSGQLVMSIEAKTYRYKVQDD